MRFKQKRLGPLVLQHARDPRFLSQVHVVIGGTGAVGGAEVLQLVSLFEEARGHASAGAGAGAPAPEPRILVTARSEEELRGFEALLRRLGERDHGRPPEAVEGVGLRTPGGVLIDLRTFGIDPAVPELSGYAVLGRKGRERARAAFLAASGLDDGASDEARAAALERAVRERVATPLTDFLARVGRELEPARGADPGRRPFRAVSIGIPLASVATYKLGDLEAAARDLGMDRDPERLARLKDDFVGAVVDDLAHVAAELAEEVVVAHTTAVGGMYDEEDGTRQIRLGFAHSAKGDLLRSKQDFARKLTELYAARGIRMLITAAAIGIDAILRRERVPTNGRIRDALRRASADREDDAAPLVPEAALDLVHVQPPVELDPLAVEGAPLHFPEGRPLVPERMIRSGENGFFSVPNADALYRVMRVTSSAELGLVMARVAAFGDDPEAPLFPDNVCYYTETDNSRQVFDLLADPPMLRDQLSGLSPKALQDLGSSKHQGELHTLGLVTLLHRLRDVEAEEIPRYGDPGAFEPRAWFEQHSRDVTLERALEPGPEELARLLRALVTADAPEDLEPLLRRRVEARDRPLLHRVLREVLHAVWSVPSLGSPLLFEDERGARRVRAGAFCAPLDQALVDAGALGRGLREGFEQHCRDSAGACRPDDGAAWERWVEFHLASAGFVDLRPLAVVVSARVPRGDLSGQVEVLRDAPALRAALDRLEPYAYFTTSGLLALRARLAALVRMAHEYDLSLGSANEYRSHLVHDATGRALLVPGIVEAFRMVWEGLEKNTGGERLDGRWGYPRP